MYPAIELFKFRTILGRYLSKKGMKMHMTSNFWRIIPRASTEAVEERVWDGEKTGQTMEGKVLREGSEPSPKESLYIDMPRKAAAVSGVRILARLVSSNETCSSRRCRYTSPQLMVIGWRRGSRGHALP